MELSAQPGPRQRRRRARRITCHDAQHRRQFVGLWAVPSLGVVVMVVPAAESARFDREEAISLRAALDEMIAELPSPWCE
jgi:hypothetical protein